jgi:hypothetical protein
MRDNERKVMKDNKFTPGPWIIGEKTSEDNIHCLKISSRNNTLVDIRHGYTDEVEANARLIAAAPELLEALEKSALLLDHAGRELDDTSVGDEIQDFLKQITVAIAKAKGGDK